MAVNTAFQGFLGTAAAELTAFVGPQLTSNAGPYAVVSVASPKGAISCLTP